MPTPHADTRKQQAWLREVAALARTVSGLQPTVPPQLLWRHAYPHCRHIPEAHMSHRNPGSTTSCCMTAVPTVCPTGLCCWQSRFRPCSHGTLHPGVTRTRTHTHAYTQRVPNCSSQASLAGTQRAEHGACPQQRQRRATAVVHTTRPRPRPLTTTTTRDNTRGLFGAHAVCSMAGCGGICSVAQATCSTT